MTGALGHRHRPSGDGRGRDPGLRWRHGPDRDVELPRAPVIAAPRAAPAAGALDLDEPALARLLVGIPGHEPLQAPRRPVLPGYRPSAHRPPPCASPQSIPDDERIVAQGSDGNSSDYEGNADHLLVFPRCCRTRSGICRSPLLSCLMLRVLRATLRRFSNPLPQVHPGKWDTSAGTWTLWEGHLGKLEQTSGRRQLSACRR